MSEAGLRGRRILLTGGRGFIGVHLAQALRASGAKVVATTRSEQYAAANGLSVMNLQSPEGAEALLAGVSAVVHLAGITQVYGKLVERSDEEFRRANVEDTRTIAQLSARAKVASFIYLSSLSAVAVESEELLSEASTPRPGTPYGRSKLEAERVVAEIGASSGMNAVSLRPPMVFGAGMKGNALRLFDLAWSGMPVPVGSIRNRRSVLYIGNLVAAISSALATPDLRGAFFIADEPALSTAELVRHTARALGRPSRVLSIPPAVLSAAARVGDVISRVVPSPLTTRDVARLATSLAVDSRAFSAATGYRAPHTIEEGLALTAEWYRASRG